MAAAGELALSYAERILGLSDEMDTRLGELNGELRGALVLGASTTVAESLLPDNGVEAYTQGLMDLGATVCVRKQPLCEACPVASDCVARRDGRTAELPSPRPKRMLPRRATRLLAPSAPTRTYTTRRFRCGSKS